MDLTEKKGYLTIFRIVHKEGKILLRSTNGVQEWFHTITICDQLIKRYKNLYVVCRDVVRKILNRELRNFGQ